MAKLKLGTIPDDKPVKLTIELPAAIHRDLVAYSDALGRETGQGAERRDDRCERGENLCHHQTPNPRNRVRALTL